MYTNFLAGVSVTKVDQVIVEIDASSKRKPQASTPLWSGMSVPHHPVSFGSISAATVLGT